jgi:hypothetical protein
MLIGFMAGCALFAVLHWLAMSLYRGILIQCAAQGTAERLDGGFYYIVPESEYIRLTIENNRTCHEEDTFHG